jgi:hypothetical protein
VLGGECLELADELGVLARREIRVDPLLERAEAQLLELRRMRLRERLVGEVGQRRPAPQREGLAQLAAAVAGSASVACATSARKQSRSSSDGSTLST